MIFSNEMTDFSRGLERLFPLVRDPVPQWNLNLVLSRLTGTPFDLLIPYAPILEDHVPGGDHVSEVSLRD